jgi:arylsulfatase A-like enzyme
VLALLFVVTAPVSLASIPARRPNIVFILADDLGYGDLSSYGASDIHTPNIDRLAQEGMCFTAHYAAANTCSPSRAALMTGRYPPRTRVNAVLSYDTVEGLPLEEITLAEILRQAGYTTGMVGKWHLGQVEAFMPWHQGFEEFFGVATSNDDHNFFLYVSSGTQYRRVAAPVDQTQLTQQYTAHARQFIEQHAGQSKPFFLYLAPHTPHIPLHPQARFVGTSQRGLYGDVVQELDEAVGQLLEALQRLAIDAQTLVVFASDNGAWRTMRAWGGSNGVLREGKLTTFEGGHRVPALVRWPGHIPPGVVHRQLTTMMDWFPTLAGLSGASLPDDRVIDGRDLAAVLDGSGQREPTPFFYFALRPPHESPGHRLAGVREGKWKYKAAQRGYYPYVLEPLMKVGLYSHGAMLFDLDRDPGEQQNLIAQYPEEARRLQQLMEHFATHNPMPAPINSKAAARDAAGWEQLWYGVAASAFLVLLCLLTVTVAMVKLLQRFLQR